MTDAQLIQIDFEHWREAGACRDLPDVTFFPNPDDSAAVSLAQAVCESCPVIDECITFAIETRQPDGIWGGMTTKERTRLRRTWLDEMRQAS